MSYLIDDEKVTQPVKKRDHRGQNNPHFGHVMSPKSKQAISTQQSLRYAAIRQLINQKPLTEDRVREIIKETIDSYLAKNIETKNNRPNHIPL
jgi:hypothetical protein